MAGLCGLKILPLLAGVFCLAGSSTTPGVTEAPSNSGPTQALSDHVTPTITQAIRTTNTTSKAAPVPVKCSYTVTPEKSGFTFNITNSISGEYKITMKGNGQNYMSASKNFSATTFPAYPHLKPCTEYGHEVTFLDADNNGTPCSSSSNENGTVKMEMSKDIIDVGSCKPGYLCYFTAWNISSLLTASNNAAVQKCGNDLCVKLNINDYCMDLLTTFKDCANNIMSISTPITFATFLNPAEIQPRVSNKYPVKISETLPPKCTDLTIDYQCYENNGRQGATNVSDLKAFTSYNCTGLVKDLNNNTKTITVDVNTHCNVEIRQREDPRPTNSSLGFKWTTVSTDCHVTDELTYNCMCHEEGKSTSHGYKPKNVTECEVSGLNPYIDYTCTIQVLYDGREVHKKTLYEKTSTGRPGDITNLRIKLSEHNRIEVTCDAPQSFNGPKEEIHAKLHNDGGTLAKQSSDCSFDFKDLYYLTTYKLEVFASNGDFKSDIKTQTVDTLYNDKVVIGVLVFFIILTSVALLLVVYKICVLRRLKSRDQSENMMLIHKPSDEENLLPVEPIAADVLLETYKRKWADEGRLFLEEFQSIPRIFSRYPMKEAKKNCNGSKNRYLDILPYDYNRVQLTTGNGEAGCDYINASFIDGFKESKKYIAAQGPKEETVTDFWRMVWEQQSSIIVMVTRCEEGNRVKCAQYWPSTDRQTEIFEEFVVKLNSEDQCPDYTIRHLTLMNKREKNSEREVTHIQFMSWPDHGVPGEPHLLLRLRRRVNAFKNFFSGPIVIHCSAGVGRTGTYIGIDAMMEGLETENRVDIYGYVVRLRRQRCLMVQVEAQYILIHQALLEYNQFGETEISLPELHSSLSMLKQKNAGNEPSLLEEEFERLPSFKNWRTFNSGISEENKKRNRCSSIIPYDINRVLLKLNEGNSRDSNYYNNGEEEDSSDDEDEATTKYINASHINGYWGPRAFIMAQTPLPDTIADFWLMVHQKKASTIVALSDGHDEEKEFVYWDKEKKIFGEVEVEVESTNASPAFITRNMLIRHVKRKDSRAVKHVQFLKWVDRELPENPQDLTDVIKDIKSSHGGSLQRAVPVVVHCNDGSSRSGIFCALWNLLDSAETEKQVDVFQVVKTIRKERQGLISSLNQYQFLYDALEGIYPVQNGDVRAAQAPDADNVQVVDETQAAEMPASTTSNNQQGGAESDGVKGDKKEEPEMSSSPTEMRTPEDPSNDSTVPLEV
ncbi:receptor-type tyrosine-protein phosphatase C [Aulostomus maculatus]